MSYESRTNFLVGATGVFLLDLTGTLLVEGINHYAGFRPEEKVLGANFVMMGMILTAGAAAALMSPQNAESQNGVKERTLGGLCLAWSLKVVNSVMKPLPTLAVTGAALAATIVVDGLIGSSNRIPKKKMN